MAKKNIKAIYDTCRLLAKTINTNISKGQDVPEDVLSALHASFTEIVEFEKAYLIQCQDRFYGTILMDLEVEIDFKQDGSTDLKIDRSPLVLSINPMYCVDYKFPEFTGLIVSEILRLVYLHPTEFAERNSEKDPTKHKYLEDASSAAVHEIVKRDIRLTTDDGAQNNGCRLPLDSYTSAELSRECNVRARNDMDLGYYYELLRRLRKSDNSKDEDQQGLSQNTGNQQASGQSAGNQNSKGISTPNNKTGNKTHSWEGSDSEEVKSEIMAVISNAYNSLDERARGEMPSSISSQIKALLAPPEINWKQVLRKMVGSVPVPYRKTRTRLNRRQPYRTDLCGKLPKRTVDIICCFDTSGSMSDEDLEYCMNEVFNIVKSYEGYSITVLECDAEVQRVYKAKKMSDLKTKMMGRGGTWFTPAIEYINGEGNFKNSVKFPDAGKYRQALMVYFTDGYGEGEIPKPKTYRNLWVVMGSEKNLSLKEPYGDVKSLTKDNDWKKMKGRS